MQNHPSHHRQDHNRRSLFSVGNPEITNEFFIDNKRYLSWDPSKFDSIVSVPAGWANLEVKPDLLKMRDTNVRVIEVPQGTRSAERVLAGYEGERSEKRAMLDKITFYQSRVSELLGMIDIGVSLNTVSVPRDLEGVIVIPPHNLTDNVEKMKEWRDGFILEIEQALAGTTTFENPHQLATDYGKSIDMVISNG